MRFVLFTEKTTSQCMRALNERLQIKGTKTRPTLDGWIEKSGRFSISLTTPVLGKFTRTTRLRGTAEREDGHTVVRGFVPDGVSQRGLVTIWVVIVLLAIYMYFQGQLVIGVLALLGGAALTVPLKGDHINHDILLYELEKTLNASPKAPKPTTTKKSTTQSTTQKKPAPRRTKIP